MTLKVHVIYHHLVDYFELSGETLWHKSTEFIQSTHSKFRMHGEVHGYKVTKVLGMDQHVRKSNKSVVHWNSLCLGGQQWTSSNFIRNMYFNVDKYLTCISMTLFDLCISFNKIIIISRHLTQVIPFGSYYY